MTSLTSSCGGEPVIIRHDYVDVWTWTKGKWLLKSTVTQTETVIPTVR